MSTQNIVVIGVVGGAAEVCYHDESINVVVIDMDNDELYLYKNYICTVSDIHDDGTLDLICVDTTDGSINNRLFHSVPAGEIEFYGIDSDGEYHLEEDW